MEGVHPAAYQETDKRGQRQRAPDIAADHLIDDADEQHRVAALPAGRLRSQPDGYLLAIGGKVDAQDEDQNDVDERAEDARDNRKRLRGNGGAAALEKVERLLLGVVVVLVVDTERLENADDVGPEQLELVGVVRQVIDKAGNLLGRVVHQKRAQAEDNGEAENVGHGDGQ